ASAGMVGRAAQGNPWALAQIMGSDGDPSREEVVAELLLFIRETVRELGDQRAAGFLKKFYGWYLGRGRFPKPFKQELVTLPTIADVETRLLAAAPGAADVLARLESEVPEVDEVLLDSLPISVYGGGWSAIPAMSGGWPWTWPSGALAGPDEAKALKSELLVDGAERARVRRDQLGEAAGGNDRRVQGAELLADPVDDRVDLPREAVDQARLERRHGRLRDHALRSGERHLRQARRAGEERVHRDLDPRREHTARELPCRRDYVEVRRGAEVDDDARHPVALAGGDCVRDPVGADLPRVVVPDRHAGRDARPEHEQVGAGPPIGKCLVLADELRHRRADDDPVERLEVDERTQGH